MGEHDQRGRVEEGAHGDLAELAAGLPEHADHPRAAELFDRHTFPAFHDPFAGGGSLPLEAQRLGLEAHASDLNPVAVLINKAMIEIPSKFAGRPPVNPETRNEPTVVARTWTGAQGLADDVRHYGRWMRDEAEKRIGHLYPPVEITPEMVRDRADLKPYQGRKLTVIAWLWARTVKSPNRRTGDAPTATRCECVTALRSALPHALRLLQTGNIALVDLAQAAIGPRARTRCGGNEVLHDGPRPSSLGAVSRGWFATCRRTMHLTASGSSAEGTAA